MNTIKITIRGIRPLLMSNPQTVDIENPYSVQCRKLNADIKAARKKGDEDRLVELARKQKRLDFMASAYWLETQKCFFLPDTVVMACIKGGAQTLRKGKDIERGVIIEEPSIIITEVPKVKSLEDAHENAAFKLDTPAKVPPKTGALFIKRRCMMPTGWRASFTLMHEPSIIAETTLRNSVEAAGKLVGVGGWRPTFGRFVVEDA